MSDHQPLILGIVALAIANGIFSPLFLPTMILLQPLAPAILIGSPTLLFYFTSLILSTATLIVAGVPAALFERATGRSDSDAASLGIWLAGVALLTLPALLGAGR